MTRYVALLRGINVGGHVVRMDQLRALFEEMALTNVKTFIASGNVLFDSSSKSAAALEQKIGKALRQALGYDVAVFLRTGAEMAAVCGEAGDKPSEGSLFVGFLQAPLDAREKKLVASLATPVDDLRVINREIYWRAKKNFSDAIFQPAKMEKLLGKPATFRNVTTVQKIGALLIRAVLGLVLLAPLGASAQVPGLEPPPVVAHRVTVLREWVDAVLRHVPGETDAALLLTSAWDEEELRHAWLDVNFLNGLLREPTHNRFSVRQWGREIPVVLPREDLEALQSTAKTLIRRPGADLFRKRAAVYHMDIAMLLVGDSAASPIYSSFLLPRRIVVRSGDGEQEGIHGGDVNWEFARVLLDAVADPGHDLDVRLWYQASLAYKLWHEQLDTPHFNHALQLFPRDAAIVFLNGALQEAFADARVQSFIRDAQMPPGTRLEVESEETHLRAAESLFRRAREAGRNHTESAVRLGRTLGRLGRHADAATALRTITGTDDRLLAYYAHLFLGSEEEALGRFGEARAAYEKAAAIVPFAQAPRLALSQLSHRLGDRMSARLALVHVLEPNGVDGGDDPFWTYRLAAGRDANNLVEALYRSINPGHGGGMR